MVGSDGFYQINENGEVRSCKLKGSRTNTRASAWYLMKLNNSAGYKIFRISAGATSSGKRLGVRKRVHVALWEAFVGNIPEGYRLDHIDGQRDNNTLSNLRLATTTENGRNSRKRRTSPYTENGIPTSSYKGVMWSKNTRKWMAQIVLEGKSTYIGIFTSEEDAARAYDHMAKKHFKEFARPNFVN